MKKLGKFGRALSIVYTLTLILYALLILSGCSTLGSRSGLADTQANVIKADGNADADTLLDYANALFKSGNLVQAARVLDDMPDPARRSARWLVLSGAVHGELGDKIGARAAFEQAAALGSEAARQNLAKLSDMAPLH